MYLIDTDYVVDWLKGQQPARALLEVLAPDGLAISIITYGEVYEGIYYGTKPQEYTHGFQQFLRGANVLPLTRRIMQRFARVRGELRRTGLIIGDPDILIVATALYHELVVVTRNIRHFERIPGLTLYQPDAPAP